MQRKLPDLVDKIPKINKNECLKCMVRKKIKSECEFIGFNMIDYITNPKNVGEDLLSQKAD